LVSRGRWERRVWAWRGRGYRDGYGTGGAGRVGEMAGGFGRERGNVGEERANRWVWVASEREG
jgi:hypothetical protein